MEEEREEYEPKISLVERIFLLLYTIIFIEIIAPFLPIIGGVFALPVAGYLLIKGTPLIRFGIPALADVIPFLSFLPITTMGLIATFILDSNPKLAAATGAVTAVTSLAQGARGIRAGGAAQSAEGASRQGGVGGGGTRASIPRSGENGPAGIRSSFSEEKSLFENKEAGHREEIQETEEKVFGRAPEPLSASETQSIFEDIPKTSGGGNEKNVIIKGNEVDLKKAA